MKARIKGTYEWLDFEATVLQNTEFITEGYLCVKTGEVYKKEDLVFLDEYKDTLNVEPPKSIDWQDVRERAAIAAMQGTITILSSSDRYAFGDIVVEGFSGNEKTYPNEIAEFAIACANALVKQLKGE